MGFNTMWYVVDRDIPTIACLEIIVRPVLCVSPGMI